MAKTSKSRRNIYILLGLLAVLIAAAAIKSRMKPKGQAVEWEQVAKRTIHETVSASGKVFPETEVKISSDVSGEIVELFIKEGDTVKLGQVLAKIRPDEYQSAVEQGQAALQSAKAQKEVSSSGAIGSKAQIKQLEAEKQRVLAQLNAAKAAHQRNEQMFNEGIISQADYDASFSNLKNLEAGLAAADAAIASAKANFQSAQGNIDAAGYSINSAQARLRELQTSLGKTIVRAPMDGIVSKLSVEKGERVVGTLQMAGTEMMRVADMSRMEVQVEVSENDILKVALGDTADIEIDAYLGRLFKGRITEIGSSANNVSSSVGGAVSLNTDQVTNFIVKILINPASYASLMQKGRRHPFRPGMSAAVDIFTETASNVLSVPIIAVTARDKDTDKEKSDGPKTVEVSRKTGVSSIQELVFVVEADTVSERIVQTGVQDNDFIEIKTGLKGDETIVTGPYSAIARELEQGTQVHEKEKKDADKKSWGMK